MIMRIIINYAILKHLLQEILIIIIYFEFFLYIVFDEYNLNRMIKDLYFDELK